MDFHPIADIFPLLEGDDFTRLAEDIRQNGLHLPITRFEGKILDGRNRFRACQEVGVQPRYVDFSGTFLKAMSFVWSLNAERRHLNASQKAICESLKAHYCAEYRQQLEQAEQEAKQRQRDAGRHGSEGGRGNKKTLRSPITEGFPDNSQSTRDVRAEIAGVANSYISDADRIVEEHPEYVEPIQKGEKTITQVKRELKEQAREEKRQQAQKAIEQTPTVEQALTLGAYSTIVIDPPWDWGDEGDVDQLGRARPTYQTMSLEQLLAFPVGKYAAADAHLYLWITNRSLPKGFQLLEAWGFRYITCLTWCKPSFGMGNYFRGQTEHVLFGVRGSLLLKRKDVGTCFQAPRGEGGHSSKPDAFVKLVESCSPGPYLEIFARRQLSGWTCWGGEL